MFPQSIARHPFAWLFVPLTLGFSSSKSSTASTSSTSNQVTDNRVAASEGSISAGSGATVNVQSSDAAVVKSTGDAISRVAENANDAVSETARAVVGENADVTKAALNAGQANLLTAADLGTTAIKANTAVSSDALDFGERALQITTAAANQAQQQTNDLIQRTNEQFTAKLASNAGDAPSAVATDTVKYIAIAAGVVILGLAFFRNNKAA